jgi:CheY-like chemotaxis protein
MPRLAVQERTTHFPLGMRRGRVGIINTNPEMIAVISGLLRGEGYSTCTAHLLDFREGDMRIEAWLAAEDPAVLVVDIPPPYGINARFVIHEILAVAGERGVVLSSTNSSEVRPYVPGRTVHELLGKPYDLGQLIQAVKAATPPGFGPALVAPQ